VKLVNVTVLVPVFVTVTDCGALVVLSVCETNVKLAGATVTAGVVDAPVPASVTDCGLPVALSATLTAAVRAPDAVGLNVTLIVQLALAASEAGHWLVCAKSPAFAPVTEMPVTVSAALPEFVSVTVCAGLVVFNACEPNVNEVGASVTTGALAAAPVPVSGTVCGLPVALSANETAAVRAPDAVGLNVTLIVQFAFAASDAGHVFVCAKSPRLVPVTVTPEIVNAAVPVFVTVIACAGLVVFSACDANVKLVGANVTTGVLAAAPVPVSGTNCGLPAALSAKLTFALRAPVAVGVNVTLTVQFAFAASEAGQALVCAKSPGLVPVTVIPEIVSAALPVLVSVMVCDALVVFSVCDANVKLAGERPATGAKVPVEVYSSSLATMV
jgi:hypothetical protein